MLYKYQKKAVKKVLKSLSRNRSAYLASFPGSGKSLMSITVAKKLGAKNIIILCPKILEKTWEQELEKWDYSGKYRISTYESCYKLINTSDKANLIICDEATKIKNPRAKRTKNTFSLITNHGCKVLYLSGTPFNRPIDLWSILRFERIIQDWMFYIRRYCAAKHTGFGWDTKGSSNISELKNTLSGWMYVIPEKVLSLPIITTKLIVLDISLKDLTKEAQELLEGINEDELFGSSVQLKETAIETAANIESKLAQYLDVGEISTLRKEFGITKARDKELIEYLKEKEEQIVIFAQHHEVFSELESQLPNCVTVHGGKTQKQNQKSIDLFKDGVAKYIVLSLGAASEGLTLTNSRQVVFIESPWKHSNFYQALKRVHRIGQNKNVSVEIVVTNGLLDSMVAKIILKESKTFKEFFDNENV